MEQHYYTFIVKIPDGGNKLLRGYVVDNNNQERGYFEGFPGLEGFILSHLNLSSKESIELEPGLPYET